MIDVLWQRGKWEENEGRDTVLFQEMNCFHLRIRGHSLFPFIAPGESDSAASCLSMPAGHAQENIAMEM